MGIPRPIIPTPADAWGPLPPHAADDQPPVRHWKRLERLFLVLAVVCFAYFGYVTVEARLYQAFENRELDAILESGPTARSTRAAPTATDTTAAAGSTDDARATARRIPVNGEAVGRIEIPRLKVGAIVRAGSDARTLRLAVGHIPGTALPGEPGNVGLAGHRDTFFRQLRNIRENDDIRVITPDGAFTYRVSRTTIVDPKDVWVLDPTSSPALTLVTCYPFTYIGSAPQRFIVRAELVSTQTSRQEVLDRYNRIN